MTEERGLLHWPIEGMFPMFFFTTVSPNMACTIKLLTVVIYAQELQTSAFVTGRLF
jgi:hypothetical protein